MRNKVIISLIAGILVILIAYWATSEEEKVFTTTAQKGNFSVKLITSGELEARSSVPILGPSGLRGFRIWQIKIENLVDEGTVVKKGDFVGSLDKSQIADKYGEEESNLIKIEAQYTQTRLDTTLEMTQARNDIRNANYALKEAEIALAQSKYEPPATIRQAEITLEKAVKSLEDTKKKYIVKGKQARAKMQEVNVNMSLARRKMEQIDALEDQLTIMAPENGMVIYERDWNGTKKGPGSMMNTWDPKIASLPDLSTMVSRTFINEVEISKIKVGQHVNIGLDAFPGKKMTGKVKSVSNVGQQNPNSDGKVFEVMIDVIESDSVLRPAMTTSNEIIIKALTDVLYVPLEAVFNQGDSLHYVVQSDGLRLVKKEIETGISNDNFVVVEKGLIKGEEILLNLPDNHEEFNIKTIE